MTGPEILDLGREAISVLLVIILPLLGIALGIGLTIAFFQSITQIQEMTLTFVPKIIAVFTALLVLLPFIGAKMSGFMLLISDKIIGGG